MEYAALTILILTSLIGFMAIFVSNIGTLIIFLGVILFSILTGFSVLPWQGLLWIAGLYAIGELLEFFLVAASAKKFGASAMGIWGALLGGLAGAVLGPVFLGLGAFAGGCLGIFLGAFVIEQWRHQDTGKAIKAGVGGLIGRIGAIVLKCGIAVAMGYTLWVYLSG